MIIQEFRKRPVVIRAAQWVSDLPEQLAEEIAEWCDGSYDSDVAGGCGPHGEDWGCLEIDTLEGTMEVSPYDWVIEGVAGEFYPCKPDIFARTYEPVEESGR
ncbi:hypothetical protein [Mycobacteroides immunogenum]|uniref:Phage protein n=1 Tax=Mycobacteroides immunogenum TaxID=83262 RepID=A0A7V8LQW1_9MYCO|nr:hypothetical protein [Mycobacteroides immunogenum]KPG13761.1 hypothetical protein AN909_05830 [Mycobacteroides immunogenum]KPG14247.1 hypothetical protein AN908_06565 [Mycobacteroides immunogenum]KPG14325.1 hypothetical protein AN908_07090 [Mycobacteroides immunogenum]KPG17475.1 hypothetical protein AN910_05055 [Mycobacteroides immunogenum]KPG23940.1 hypothetical protein AN911_00100 [Mycobacteroides immunogenum]